MILSPQHTDISGLGSTFKPILLSDYKNPNDPQAGAFFPQDKGHNPASFVMQVPPRIAIGSGYAIIYKYYLEKSTTAYNSSTLTFLTIDNNTSAWLLPMQSPSPPTPLPTNPPVDASGTLLQTTWTVIIVSLVVLALLMTAVGFLLGRYAKQRKIDEEGLQSFVPPLPPPPVYEETQFLTSNASGFDTRGGPFRRNTTNTQVMRSEYSDGHNSDDEVIVFRSMDRPISFAGSVGSKTSDGSQPKSILKKRVDVEREALEAQIWDPVLAGLHHKQHENANVVAGPAGTSAKKMVSFTEKNTTTLVDFSAPVSNGSLPRGLFVEEEEGDGGIVEESSLNFHDGGLERDVRQLLGKAVQVEEDDEEEYNSDVSDGWRNE
ncbi:UNVERIFIED_CONTAM: hypothetical protein HDU68_011912 [Siphonaria sp. JEL0065]|nr:hypothetical protein HDU68_011912 [Siphonaria sp. JEL0065]